MERKRSDIRRRRCMSGKEGKKRLKTEVEERGLACVRVEMERKREGGREDGGRSDERDGWCVSFCIEKC